MNKYDARAYATAVLWHHNDKSGYMAECRAHGCDWKDGSPRFGDYVWKVEARIREHVAEKHERRKEKRDRRQSHIPQVSPDRLEDQRKTALKLSRITTFDYKTCLVVVKGCGTWDDLAHAILNAASSSNVSPIQLMDVFRRTLNEEETVRCA